MAKKLTAGGRKVMAMYRLVYDMHVCRSRSGWRWWQPWICKPRWGHFAEVANATPPRHAGGIGMSIITHPWGPCPRYLSRQNYPAAGSGGVGRAGTLVLVCEESGSQTSGQGDDCGVGMLAVRVEIRIQV